MSIPNSRSCARKASCFGASRIEFSKFPLRPGETAVLRWLVPKGASRIARGTFTLRCVEEWYETTSTGKNRSRTLVQEQVWAATGSITDGRVLRAGKTDELQFEIPADAPSTSLSSGKTVFWELAIELDLAGSAQRTRWQTAFEGPLRDAAAVLARGGIRVRPLSTEMPSESWLDLFEGTRAA